METVLITGGTGLIGNALSKQLIERGYNVIVMTRRHLQDARNKPLENIQYAHWDIDKQEADINALQRADYIIHLAGAGVMDKRWTTDYKKQIQDSRIRSSELLVTTLKNNRNKVKALISSSAIGWYGPDKIPKKIFTETDAADKSYLGETCRLWEESIQPVTAPEIRLVKLRTGIVLSNDGGAFVEFKRSLKFGIAAILGNGKQVVSWVHIDDLCRLFIHAIENEKLEGVYNATAPVPVTNKELTLKLARKTRGKFFVPVHVPEWILKLMLGEQSIEVLKSTTVSSEKIQQAGFSFLYPGIEDALNELCRR